jgi:hypothetical protein
VRRGSQGDRFAEHIGAYVGIEHWLRHNVYIAPEEFPQIEPQSARKPRAMVRPHLYKEIDVAPIARFAPDNRAEHAHIRRAVSLSDREDRIALILDIAEPNRRHGCTPVQGIHR